MPNYSATLAAPTESFSGEVKDRITKSLDSRGIPSTRLSIDVTGGTVTLNGSVSSFYQRQLCISCCQHVAGVFHLIDRLTVT